MTSRDLERTKTPSSHRTPNESSHSESATEQEAKKEFFDPSVLRPRAFSLLDPIPPILYGKRFIFYAYSRVLVCIFTCKYYAYSNIPPTLLASMKFVICILHT